MYIYLLSALGGGEGRGEVGEPEASTCNAIHRTSHPFAVGPLRLPP